MAASLSLARQTLEGRNFSPSATAFLRLLRRIFAATIPGKLSSTSQSSDLNLMPLHSKLSLGFQAKGVYVRPSEDFSGI